MTPMSREELLEIVCQFTDDYIDEWAADGNELDKLHEITDKHVEQLEALLAQARAEGAATLAKELNTELRNPEEFDRPEDLELIVKDERHSERYRGIYQSGWLGCHRFVKHLLTHYQTKEKGDQ